MNDLLHEIEGTKVRLRVVGLDLWRLAGVPGITVAWATGTNTSMYTFSPCVGTFLLFLCESLPRRTCQGER